MPGLDSPQFRDYAFRTRKSIYGTEAAVARRVSGEEPWTPEEWEPLGSISIHSDVAHWNRDQRHINDPNAPFHVHGTRTEDSGQGRWTEGNMEPDKPYVGWAAMSKVPGHTRLVQGMAALAVAEHGSLPAADANLSEEGARFARGAARKYGMKGSKSNTEMEAGFTFGDSEASARREAASAWATPNAKHLSAPQTAQVVKDMDEQYRLRPKKSQEHSSILHPDQMKLL